MPELSVSVCGHATTIACAPEDEARLTHLLGIVHERAENARAIVGDHDRWRQLLFAAIFLADEMDSDESSSKPATNEGQETDEAALAARLSAVATRIGLALDRIEATAGGA
jgi:cell division protein ZapA